MIHYKIWKIFFFFIFCLYATSSLFSQAQETIDKCAKDLESATPELRQQAAMILGKYEEPQVTEMLLAHLKDESHLVRRAVLVSLQDRIQKRMMALSKMVDIVDLLEDKDAEVRRLASTSAQFFIGILLRDFTENSLQRSPPPITINQQKRIKAKFINSMQDSDEIVRLNNLTTLQQNRFLIFESDFKNAILQRIADTNKSVIILALQLLMSQHNLDIKAIAEKLVDHEEPDVAVALIRFLEANRYSDAATWNKLSSRANLEVSSKAIEVGFVLGIKDMEAKYSNFVLDQTNPVSQRVDLIQNLRLHSKRKEIANALLEDKTNAIKIELIRVIPQFLEKPELTKILKTYLNDSSSSIKDEATNLLFQLIANTDTDLLKLLFNSDKEFVRMRVIDKIEELKISDDEIVMEAMMDDSQKVRLKAFNLCAKNKRNNPQFKVMLSRSLEDTDSEIKTIALSALANYLSEPELLALFKTYADSEDVAIKTHIAKRLLNSIHSDAALILNKLSQDKNIAVSTQANLTMFLKGDKTKTEILANNLTSKEIPTEDRIILQHSIAKEKDVVHKAFAQLLTDNSEALRLASIQFFNFHREFYLEEYFGAIFTETNHTIMNITFQLYQSKKFKNIETIKKLIGSENQILRVYGIQLLRDNYDETFLPLLKDLFKSKDFQTVYQTLEIVKIFSIKEFDQNIIDKLKSKPDKSIRVHLFLALLMLNTDNANNYIGTITSTDEMYTDVLYAQQIKKTNETHPAKSGGKKR